MSDQNKSNFQAFGAALLGFVAVMAVGGGAMLVYSSQQSKAGARPVAAGEPIDLGSSVQRQPAVQNERRAESPAPLVGEDEVSEVAENPASASEAAAQSSPSTTQSVTGAQTAARPSSEAQATSRLEVTQHLDKPGNGSSATAIVKNTLVQEKAAKAVSKKVAPKISQTGGVTATGAVASVHYGVTSRNELMGRAAGPVYNFKGGASKGATGATGKMGGDLKTKITDIKGQLEAAGLPADQRAKLMKDLEDANKNLAETAKTVQ